MYAILMKSTLMYRAEVWEWKEQKEIEMVQCKYLKWVLGLERDKRHVWICGIVFEGQKEKT